MLSRREVLAKAAAAGATVALGCGTGPRAAPPQRPDPSPPQACPEPPPAPPVPSVPSASAPASPQYALATYEVRPSSALLWAYHAGGGPGRLELTDFSSASRRGGTVALPAETGHTGFLPVTSLEPATRYRYRWHFDGGETSSWHEFKTLPERGAMAPVHFVFGADIISMEKYRSDITDRMLATGADAFISLGDWPYCDLPEKARTLKEFRQCHVTSRSIPQLRRLVAKMPVYGIFDDHEVKNDWDLGFIGRSPARANAGIRAWDEFFPLSSTVRYRSWRWGKLAELFMLDLRSHRSPFKDPDGPKKSMLGAAQKRWLFKGLERSKAAFQIVLSTVPLGFGTTREHWNAYPTERRELMARLVKRASSTVVLTADQHWFAAHHHKEGIREFQVGPIMAFTREPKPRQPEVVARSVEPNFGEISIVPGARPRLVFTCRDKGGRPLYGETLIPSTGS